MDRVAISVRTPDGDSGFLDRPVDRRFTTSNGPGDSSTGPDRTQSTLPEPEAPPNEFQEATKSQDSFTKDITQQQIWFQLSESERQRFGQCFSLMVLKALGLRTEKIQEGNR